MINEAHKYSVRDIMRLAKRAKTAVDEMMLEIDRFGNDLKTTPGLANAVSRNLQNIVSTADQTAHITKNAIKSSYDMLDKHDQDEIVHMARKAGRTMRLHRGKIPWSTERRNKRPSAQEDVGIGGLLQEMRDSAGLEEATRRRPKRQPQVPERRRKEQQLSRLFGEAALEAASIITGADQSKLHGSKIKARLHRLAVDAAFEELDAFEKRAGRAER